MTRYLDRCLGEKFISVGFSHALEAIAQLDREHMVTDAASGFDDDEITAVVHTQVGIFIAHRAPAGAR